MGRGGFVNHTPRLPLVPQVQASACTGIVGLVIPTSGRTIPVTGIVEKNRKIVGIVSHNGIVKGSAGIVGFNTITLPQQSHVSGIVDFLTIPTFRGSGLPSQSSRQKPGCLMFWGCFQV